MEQKYYKIREVSEVLGITVRTVRQWIRDGKIKSVKFPGSRMHFIPKSELERLGGLSDGNED